MIDQILEHLKIINLRKNDFSAVIDQIEFLKACSDCNLNQTAQMIDQEVLNKLLEEVNESFNELYELAEQAENADEKLAALTREDSVKQMQILDLQKEIEECEKELEESDKSAKLCEQIDILQKEFESQYLKHQTHENEMNILFNDYEIFNKIDQSLVNAINCINVCDGLEKNSENMILKKYSIIELLTGIRVIEKPLNGNKSGEEWYDIVFTTLPDTCLDEKNFQHFPPKVQKSLVKLSSNLMDSYRTIFRKRDKSSSKSGYVTVKNLNDFQIICDNQLTMMCNMLARQEIKEAIKQFLIDWVEGSQLINILINSKSSKQATLLIPPYYPLCGTSKLKLISLTGYNDDVINKFQIDKNFNSLSEWISHFTDLYNKNEIIKTD